jgi:ribonuclease Z
MSNQDFQLTILGNGSAVPTAYQHPSSQLLRYNNRRFLIDCGEGTQMQMIRYKVSARKLTHIFISHLHGDHYFGLVGLLSTLHLYGRRQPLHLYAPAALKALLDMQFKLSDTHLLFDLVFHRLPENGIVYEDNNLTVETFPLNHRIETHGFVFREKPRERKLSKAFVNTYQPGIEQMHRIKQGADFRTADGQLLENRAITLDPAPARAYAYCSDTSYDESIIPFIQGVDVLYHEATFDDSMTALAKEKYHTTARQAAQIARKAGVKKLLLGHYSARFSDLEPLLSQAREEFENSFLSREGESYYVE